MSLSGGRCDRCARLRRARSLSTPSDCDSRIEVGGAPPEVQQLAGSLNQMLQRLERGFRRLWEFTADLAHDLRTPDRQHSRFIGGDVVAGQVGHRSIRQRWPRRSRNVIG